MKFILVLFAICISLLSCGVNNKNWADETRKANEVDQASFRSLVNVKWCKPISAQQKYVDWWFFRENNTALFTRVDIETRQILNQQNESWNLVDKTLWVRDPMTNSVVLTKEILVLNDSTTGKRFMVWTTPNSNLPGDSMNLTECE